MFPQLTIFKAYDRKIPELVLEPQWKFSIDYMNVFLDLADILRKHYEKRLS